jgi:dihydrofolate reductase
VKGKPLVVALALLLMVTLLIPSSAIAQSLAQPREKLVKEGGTTFTFVTDGIESALKKAQAVAGDKDVLVAGGANTDQQYLKAGLLDEKEIHLIPVLFCQGVRLFDHLHDNRIELESTSVIESPGVTHLRYRIVK